jgi:hypothetical protein
MNIHSITAEHAQVQKGEPHHFGTTTRSGQSAVSATM